MRRAFHRAARALTLLEMLVSVALMTMLVGALFTFYFDSVEIREEVSRRADRTEIARQVLERMADELRGCLGVEQFGFPIGAGMSATDESVYMVEDEQAADAEGEADATEPQSVQPRLVGGRRNISFLTTALASRDLYEFFGEFDALPPGQHDLREVGYQLWIDPENETEDGEPIVSGILRTEKKTLNQYIIEQDDPETLRHDVWSAELQYLEFRYFDGVDWTTEWQLNEGNPLPQLIQITVGYEPITQVELDDEDLTTYPLDNPDYALNDGQTHPDRYSIIVRIPAADRFFSSRLQRKGQEFSDMFGVEGGLQ